LAQIGAAMAHGMVLVMSLWDDHAVNMLWLDGTFPTNLPHLAPPAAPVRLRPVFPLTLRTSPRMPRSSSPISNLATSARPSTQAEVEVPPPSPLPPLLSPPPRLLPPLQVLLRPSMVNGVFLFYLPLCLWY
jgi:hypothetical protein